MKSACANYPGAILFALVLGVAPAICIAPALAADPVFPTASSIGLVPPGDMVASKTFRGFTDPQRNATILMATLPAEAYATLDEKEVPEVLHNKGGGSIVMDKREPIELKAGKGFLLTGTERADKARFRKWLLVVALNKLTGLVTVEVPEDDTKYSDKVLRDALATLTQRTVPDDEQLSLLPFTVGDLAGFRIGDVLAGRAVVLIDARGEHDADATQFQLNARLMIAALPGGPKEPGEWANFARLAFDSIGGIKDVHVQMSEPLRIGGQPGFQTLADAKDDKTDTPIKVVQWLRFGTGAFMQMIGVARADVWNDEFTRLRTVRDSVDPK